MVDVAINRHLTSLCDFEKFKTDIVFVLGLSAHIDRTTTGVNCDLCYGFARQAKLQIHFNGFMYMQAFAVNKDFLKVISASFQHEASNGNIVHPNFQLRATAYLELGGNPRFNAGIYSAITWH